MSKLNPPKSPIAKQYPIWNANDHIEMSGLEFEALYNLANIFRNTVMSAESILQKNIQNGTVKWKFEDEQGKDVPQDVVEAYQKEIQTYFQAQQQAQNQPITSEEQKDLPKIDALVDANGNELKS